MNEIPNNYSTGIPMPIVTFNRAFLTVSILLSMLVQQAWMLTIIFLILLPTTLFGRKYSLIYFLGNFIFKTQIKGAETEDATLQRFNNTIATTLLGFAQIAFAIGLPIPGWVFAGMVAVASGIALMGFCVGCFLFYQFKLQRYRIFRSR